VNRLTFDHVTPHICRLAPDATTDRPALGVVVGRQRTLVVDAGASPVHAETLLQEIARAGLAAPSLLAITHWHWDHVFGMATLDLLSLAHTETRRMLAAMAGWDWSDEALDRRVEEGVEIAFCRDMIKKELPDRSGLVLKAPEISFSEQVEIDLGDVTCRLVHVGGDHGADCSVIYVPEDRAILLGDCLGPDLYHGAPHYTAARALPLFDRLLRFDADIYLESHDPEPVSRATLAQDASLFGVVSQVVDRTGGDRAAAIAALQGQGVSLDDYAMELADAFIAGL